MSALAFAKGSRVRRSPTSASTSVSTSYLSRSAILPRATALLLREPRAEVGGASAETARIAQDQ